MRPFSSLKIRYLDQNMGKRQRRAIFDKITDNPHVESYNFEAAPDFSFVFYKFPIHLVRALSKPPHPGVLLIVHIDDLSRTLDPQMLTVQTKPMCLKGRVQADVEECKGKVIDQFEEHNGQLTYTCDFGNFRQCVIAFETLHSHYFVAFKKIKPQDTWKHEVINKMYDNQVIRSISESPMVQEVQPHVMPPTSRLETTRSCGPSFIQPTGGNTDRKFKFYIRVQNDVRAIQILDAYVHELEGYKCSWIMDSKCDPKWRYIRVEFETDEHTEDAYNLLQLFPVETTVHYLIDFLK